MTPHFEAAGASDIGRVRNANEDAFRIDLKRGIFLLGDGMGGHAAGDVASTLAVDTVLERLSAARPPIDAAEAQDTILAAFRHAHRSFRRHAEAYPRTAGMGTTLTVGWLIAPDTLVIGHLGDSRLYLLSRNTIEQVTEDHTWVQQELRAGRLDLQASRNHPFAHILTRVLTAEDPPEADVFEVRVRPGDRIVICSDGLHNLVSDSEILALANEPGPVEAVVTALVEEANVRGGSDNITAILVRFD